MSALEPPGHPEDVRLIERVLEGSVDARAELGDRLGCVPRFVSHRNRQLGGPIAEHEQPDVAQDVIAVLWRKLATFRGQASIETWVFRVCSLELMNFIRKKARRSARRVSLQLDQDGHISLDYQATSNAEEAPSLRFEDLYHGLSQLAPGDEAIVRRKYYDELSFDQIAKQLGLTTSVVKHRYYSALRSLRKAMTESGQREAGSDL